jgi:heptosyltransferase-2
LKKKPSIVFVQTAFIGDLFLSLPTLARIRFKHPEHQIILICKKGLSEIFLKENKVDLAFEVEKGQSKSYSCTLKKLREFQIDYIFCPHRSLRSSLFVYQMKAKHKIGFRNWYNRIFFKNTVVYNKLWPDVIRQMNILSPVDEVLKNEIDKKDWAYLNFKNGEEKFEIIPDIFSFQNVFKNRYHQTEFIALFPGSVWRTKQWTAEGFSAVTSYLIQADKKVLLMGGPAETLICAEIHAHNPKAINLAGKLSLYESYLKLKECSLIICNDSAPAHMAASLGIPAITIFGPTTVSLGFRPWSNHSFVVENTKLNCRPCGAHGHHQCPLGHHKCMQDIKAQSVTHVIDQINLRSP